MYRLIQKKSLSIITTGSVWRCLQRPRPLPIFSYFAVFRTFLGVSLWAVVCSPQPVTVRSVRGVGLYKNVVTNCQIVSTWDHQKRVCFEPGRRSQL